MVDFILIILSNYSNVVRTGATPLSGLEGDQTAVGRAAMW